MNDALAAAIESCISLTLGSCTQDDFISQPRVTEMIMVTLNAALNDVKRFSARGHFQVITGSSFNHCIGSEHILICTVYDDSASVLVFYA
jgi:hypothetical protein